jgi:hypothetical protein
VGVRFDPAGDDDHAPRINDPACVRRQGARPAQRDDRAVLYADVQCADALGRHDLSVLDDEIQHDVPP